MRQQLLLAILTGATVSIAQDRCGSFTIKPEVADLDVRITSMSVLTTDDSQISKDTKFELDKTSEMLYSNNALCSFQPMLTCLPGSGSGVSEGFTIGEGGSVAFMGDENFYICKSDVLLYDYPDLVLDASAVILDGVAGPYFKDLHSGYCVQTSMKASACGEGDNDGDSTDRSDEVVNSSTTSDSASGIPTASTMVSNTAASATGTSSSASGSASSSVSVGSTSSSTTTGSTSSASQLAAVTFAYCLMAAMVATML